MFRRIVYFVCIFILVTSIIGCSAQSSSTDHIRKYLPNVEPERQILCEKWLDGIEGVAKKSQNREALLLVDFMHRYGVLGWRRGSKIRIYNKDLPGDYQVVVIPLLKDEQLDTTEWAEVSKQGNTPAAYYSTGFRRLNLLDIKLTPAWYGLIGLHELHHASAHHILLREKVSKCPEALEVSAYLFMDEVCKDTWGDKYNRSMKNLIQSVRKDKAASYQYHTEFDDVFGMSLSKDEKECRTTILWVIAGLRILEEEYPQNATRWQLEFMKAIHGTSKN